MLNNITGQDLLMIIGGFSFLFGFMMVGELAFDWFYDRCQPFTNWYDRHFGKYETEEDDV